MYDIKKLAKKENYDINDMLSIMEALRSPEGCPWDREQDHHSVKREFIEECYEAVEAIDTDNAELLKEELGDVLLQIIFHCEMEKEKESFCFADVVEGLAKKMVTRHPHVFGDVVVENKDEVLTNWDSIKKETKGQKTLKETFESITTAMPALMRYQKYVKKAKKYKLEEFENACKIELDEKSSEEDIGMAIAKIVEIAQQNGVDAEQALSQITKKEIDKIVI
ncbi:MAG: MazG family protein [Clostridia bacterium]